VLKKMPYDTAKDLVSVAQIGTTPLVLLVNARAHIGPGGKLRALALSANKRVPAYPNVPTFGEEGLPQLNNMNGWLGVFAPAKTPKDVVAKLSAQIEKALSSEDLKAGLGDQERRRNHAGLTGPAQEPRRKKNALEVQTSKALF
jgi:tripartite-type tricarboxylate transporter receptor subunit TctC